MHHLYAMGLAGSADVRDQRESVDDRVTFGSTQPRRAPQTLQPGPSRPNDPGNFDLKHVRYIAAIKLISQFLLREGQIFLI